MELFVGRNGDFDILVASAAKKAQIAFGTKNSSLVLIQPYPMKDDSYYQTFYDEVWYPIDGKIHPKAAIKKRNEWMIDRSDLLVAYVEPNRNGGAFTAIQHAKKNGVEIINLAEK